MSNDPELVPLGALSGGSASNPHTGPRTGSDSRWNIWSLYLTHAQRHDKTSTDSWKGDMEGILIFTGLFSAIVAAFLMESYQTLQPDPEDTTIQLLSQISLQLAAISNGTHLSSSPPFSQQASSSTSSSAVRINVAWSLSLALGVTCALTATLIQQWTRRYLQTVSRHDDSSPDDRAHMRAYFAEGAVTYGLSHAVEAILAVLHMAVFLFFAGLSEFLYNLNKIVGSILLAFVALFGSGYIALSILPVVYHNCPYHTPLSPMMWFVWQSALLAYHYLLEIVGDVADSRQGSTRGLLSRFLGWLASIDSNVQVYRTRLLQGMRRTREESAKNVPFQLDSRALAWTVDSLDNEREYEDFLAGIPDFAQSKVRAAQSILTDAMLVKGRLAPCIHSLVPLYPPIQELTPAPVRYRRIAVCLDAIWTLAECAGTELRDPVDIYASPDTLHTLVAELTSHGLNVYPTPDLDPPDSTALAARVQLTKDCALALLNRLRIRGHQTPRLPQTHAAYLARDLGMEPAVLQAILPLGKSAQLANVARFAGAALPLVRPTLRARSDADPCYRMVRRTLQVLSTDFVEPIGAFDEGSQARFMMVWGEAQRLEREAADCGAEESAAAQLYVEFFRVMRQVFLSLSREEWERAQEEARRTRLARRRR
ncbi:hypothetical protein BV25DRAFT_1833296 [Artomyces pyxidatus]|uniref:Uncharacterized protein n=1 Tax=Artomyces pyxidatus TaxID=48021 RepID=A0ACB8SGS5_9AGAM|nr:hypothetical protein BV25DRAFT_1833296 [Artomyces pyxidatus]